jgi:hypothetical protein
VGVVWMDVAKREQSRSDDEEEEKREGDQAT